MIVLLVVSSWLVVGSLVALGFGAVAAGNERPIDPPRPVVKVTRIRRPAHIYDWEREAA